MHTKYFTRFRLRMYFRHMLDKRGVTRYLVRHERGRTHTPYAPAPGQCIDLLISLLRHSHRALDDVRAAPDRTRESGSIIQCIPEPKTKQGFPCASIHENSLRAVGICFVPFVRFFDGAPLIRVPGRMYPVEVRYVPTAADNDIQEVRASIAV